MEDSDVQDKIIELENMVTELEEEKGNLQLRLVDFEDMTGKIKDTVYWLIIYFYYGVSLIYIYIYMLHFSLF